MLIFKYINLLQQIAPMGIDGLLKLLNQIIEKQHLSSFQNTTAAIDIMSWIYKGCYRCAYEHNQNIQNNNFLYVIFQMLDLLKYYHITPICVFDGRHVGKKGQTLEKRKKMKEENKKKGLQFLQVGNQEEARKYLSRCIIIDQKIISTTMKALYTRNIKYFVAPFQSDSQIAKFVHLGIADFAITQDSDLIIYDVKVLLKLGTDGECNFIDLKKWSPNQADNIYLRQFLKMDALGRVQAAILAGSDYNSSIKGIGIKKAIKYLAQYKQINKVIQVLRSKKTFAQHVPQNYQQIVLNSKLIFSFATVYNQFQKKLQFLHPELLQELKPENISDDELKKIVGQFYDYDESVICGKKNSRTLAIREINKIELNPNYTLNIINLQQKQKANNIRKIQFEQLKKRKKIQKQFMLQNQEENQIQTPIKKTKIKTIKSIPEIKIQLTPEEKKKQQQMRKTQKLQKFNRFKSMLQSLEWQQSDSQQKLQSNESKKQEKQQQQQQQQQDEEEYLQQQSQKSDFDLNNLNSFAKTIKIYK